jgi:hypothetical protein
VSKVDYYLVVMLLGLGNLVFAVIAYRQRDKQIKGNQLRETQVELAELRNEMAQRRMEYLGAQVELLREIRDGLAPPADAEPPDAGASGGVMPGAPSSRPETRPQPARTSRRSRPQPHAPA